MLENRSFDQMLGLLREAVPAIEGVPHGAPKRFNEYPVGGTRYPQQAGATYVAKPDLPHEYVHVVKALEHGNGRFVERYAVVHPETSQAQRQQVMACFSEDQLPPLYALARSFVVCDHWHASVPGPTWPNRLFAMSGTSLGRVDMPEPPIHCNLHRYPQPSVFRRLQEAGRSHRIYFGDFPLALLLEDRRSRAAAKHFSRFERFLEDVDGPEADFPEFAFIEPDYLWPGCNDDHPPHDVSRGQTLIADVYDALRGSKDPELWHSTLLVVTYDEHGGFYDHVAPPADDDVVAPDDSPGEHGFAFDRLGVRVPALLVSPWLAADVSKERLDHTSLLRYLQDKWSLGDLGQRVASARSALGGIPLLSAPREDTPARLPRVPAPKRAVARAQAKAAAPPLTKHQRAIVALSEYLESQTPAPPRTRARAAARKLEGPAEASLVARERAERFLRQRGARL